MLEQTPPPLPRSVPSLPPGLALARFSEARGYAVFEAGGELWARGVTTKRFFDRVPLQSTTELDLGALRRGLRAARALGALYASCGQRGTPSGLYVRRPRDYALERVPDRERRRQIRRGLERTEIRWVDPEALLPEGLELNTDTMTRQRRFDPELGRPQRWRRFVRALETPGMRCAGAFADGRLAAYAVACLDGGWLHVRYRMARADALADRAAVALDHWMLVEAARDPDVEVVSQGFVPVSASGAGLDGYKRSLGYEVIPVRRALQLHPVLHSVVASDAALRTIGLVAKARSKDRRLDTLSALLRGAAPSAEAH